MEIHSFNLAAHFQRERERGRERERKKERITRITRVTEKEQESERETCTKSTLICLFEIHVYYSGIQSLDFVELREQCVYTDL